MCHLAIDHPPRKRGVNWLIPVALLGILAGLLAGCSPSRPPLPDVRPTLAELDRAHRLVWMHPLTVATWRAAQ